MKIGPRPVSHFDNWICSLGHARSSFGRDFYTHATPKNQKGREEGLNLIPRGVNAESDLRGSI